MQKYSKSIQMIKLRVGSLNVRGMGDCKKRKSIFNFVLKNKLDIILLQETHVCEENNKEWEREWTGTMKHSFGTTQTGGVTILFSKKLKVSIKECSEIQGRIINVLCEINEQKYSITNVYAPNNDDPEFFLKMIEIIEKSQEVDFLYVGGDFNLVLNPEIDRHKSTYNNEHSKEILSEYLNQSGLCDIWRMRNENVKRYTWHRPRKESASRIDMILIPMGQASLVTECDIIPAIRTDHSLCIVELTENEITRGPGFWRFNNKLLDEREFEQGIIDTISEAKTTYILCEPGEKWTCVKNECISFSKIYAKNRAKCFRDEINQLQEVKSHLIGEILKDNVTQYEKEFVNDKIECIDHELLKHDIRKTDSSIFRSRAEWACFGEHSTKQFFNLEKRNYEKKNMKCIKMESGEISYDQGIILEEQTKFYKGLYKKNPNSKFSMKKENYMPKLGEKSKIDCDRDLEMGEIFDAIMTMKNGKVGGPDGFTVEFYRKFYAYLKEILFEMYKNAYQEGILPFTCRKGLISLLPKPGKDTRFVKNMRALTMLNVDFKILSKLMDNRLREVIPEIVHPDQTGFVPGRNITTNIRKSIDVMEYCKQSRIPAVIMSVDMEKCFDRIEYDAIYGALDIFNFGHKYIRWVSLFYTEFYVCTQNYGHRSRWFQKTRSVNQGCNISPGIFLLVGELLSLKLKNTKNIRGIPIGSTEILLSQFADDMDLYLPYDKIVLDAVLDVFTHIEVNTGLKVSYEKTTLYRIGSIANTNAKLYTKKNLKWSNGILNTLGFDLQYENLDHNLDALIDKAKMITSMWMYRYMSWMGKILIVNSLIGSLFVYKMQLLANISEEKFQKIDKIIENFIWYDKKPKLSLKVMRTPKNEGGLGLVDLRKRHVSLLLKWVQTMERTPIIKEIARYFLGMVDVELLFKANLNKTDCNQVSNKSNFWTDLLKRWCEYNYHEPQNANSVECQILWYNSMIKKGKVTLYNQRAIKAGVIYIRDLHKNGKWLTWAEFVQRYGKCMNWLEYEGLIKSIPEYWNFVLSRENLNDDFIPLYELITMKFSRTLYARINSSNAGLINSANKWKKLLGLEYEEENHRKAFKNLYKVTTIVKLRNFQFRLLHNKIFCNDVLFYWKKVNSQECEFCENCTKQNIIHLLYNCENSRKIWGKLENWMRTCDENIEINLSNVIYNSIHPNANSVFNVIVLATKFFIFRCKCQNKQPSYGNLEFYLDEMMEIEKYIAKNTNQYRKFEKKWSPVIKLQR